MKSFKKVVSAVTFATVLSLPLTTFAQDVTVPVKKDVSILQTKIGAKYVLDTKVSVKGTTIEISAFIKGGALIKSALLKNLNWEVVDGNGKVVPAIKDVKVVNKTDVILYAKVKNLQPSLKYCFDIRLKAKIEEQLAKANIKLTGQKDLVCAKTPGKPGKPTEPTKPGKPTEPTKPGKPSEPTKPSKPGEPTKPGKPSEPTKPTNPKTEKPMENPQTAKPAEQGGFFNWIVGLF